MSATRDTKRRRLRNAVRALAAAASLAVLAGAPRGETIGIDDRGGGGANDQLGSGADFSEWRAAIEGLGHTIVPLSGFTAADLAGLDAVFLRQPAWVGIALGATEVADLLAFNAAGGGLWLMGEGGFSTTTTVGSFNQLATPLGVTYSPLVFDALGLAVSAFVAHEVTNGVVSYGVDFHRPMSSVAPVLDLTTFIGNEDVLCVRDGTGGAGNVAFTDDTSCWTNAAVGADFGIESVSNRILLENVVAYVVGPIPLSGTPPTLSLSAGGFQDLTIDVGPDYAGDFYLVLGTLSGTQPGFVYETFQVPLNTDVYFAHTLTSPNAPPLSGQFGVLDANGIGLTRFTLPAGTQPALAGTVVDHAAFVIDSGPIPLLTVVTNPVALTLTP